MYELSWKMQQHIKVSDKLIHISFIFQATFPFLLQIITTFYTRQISQDQTQSKQKMQQKLVKHQLHVSQWLLLSNWRKEVKNTQRSTKKKNKKKMAFPLPVNLKSENISKEYVY